MNDRSIFNLKYYSLLACYSLLVMLLISSCAPSQKEIATREVQILKQGTTRTMIASYYSDALHGNLTANGEIYNKNKLTAAHKKIPFGTKLQIRNPKNGKLAIVRVNDRGPYVHGRSLDLSKAAAKKLGIIKDGVAPLQVSILP